MTIQEMIARQQAIVSGARAAGRDLTAEELSLIHISEPTRPY